MNIAAIIFLAVSLAVLTAIHAILWNSSGTEESRWFNRARLGVYFAVGVFGIYFLRSYGPLVVLLILAGLVILSAVLGFAVIKTVLKKFEEKGGKR
jgi:hypothetical protein